MTHEHGEHHTDPLAPTEHLSDVRRLLLAVALVAFGVLTLAVGTQVGVLAGAGAFGERAADVREAVADRGSSDAAVVALTVGELVLAAVLGGLSLALFGARRAGLALRGTWQAVRLCVPLLMVTVGLPLALLVASDRPVVTTEVDATRAALLVVFALSIGLAEEVWFRAGVLPVLGGHAGRPWFAAVVSAVLFAGLHIGNGNVVNPIAVALVVGVPFALVRYAGGSVWGLALVHGAIDIFALLQYGSASIPSDVTPAQQAMQVAMSVAICAGYVVWFVRRGRPTEDTGAAGEAVP